jgi:hypothetical protein
MKVELPPIALDENPTMYDENELVETAYSTIPFEKDGKTWYKTAYLNPHPEKQIVGIRYVADTDDQVNVLKIEF